MSIFTIRYRLVFDAQYKIVILTLLTYLVALVLASRTADLSLGLKMLVSNLNPLIIVGCCKTGPSKTKEKVEVRLNHGPRNVGGPLLIIKYFCYMFD